DVPALLAASDVLVSVSSHEGLSLAQLEALAAGRPVLTTDVGGAREVAHGNPAVVLVPPDASAGVIARALANLAERPPPGGRDPAEAVGLRLEAVAADPPRAVLLWNAITEHKVLLADGLLGVPLFDVSPGEMYFDSLDRYFARPRPGLPYRRPADYGGRLAGVV